MDEEEKYSELLDYETLLEDHFSFKNRHHYRELMTNSIDAKIDGREFRTKFLKIFRIDRNTYGF